MGTRGPVPKRSSERRRRNKDSQAERLTVAGAVEIPPCPQGAHALAREWYASLPASAQSQYFEPSDWRAALLVVEQLTRLLKDERAVSGPAFAGIWQAMGDLFTTEAARRRARVEVERKAQVEDEPPPGITRLADLRRRVGA